VLLEAQQQGEAQQHHHEQQMAMYSCSTKNNISSRNKREYTFTSNHTQHSTNTNLSFYVYYWVVFLCFSYIY